MYPISFQRDLLNVVKRHNDLQYLIDIDHEKKIYNNMNLLCKLSMITRKYPVVYDFLEKKYMFP